MKRVTAKAARAVRLTAWERLLLRTVLAALKADCDRPVAKFNFLVHASKVFFLDQRGWWHAVPGDASKVLFELRRRRQHVIEASVSANRASWIPYFARKHDEEPNRGWNDSSLKACAKQSRYQTMLQAAIEAHRAHSKASHSSIIDSGVALSQRTAAE